MAPERILNWGGGHTSGAKRQNFLSCPSTKQSVVLMSAFVVVKGLGKAGSGGQLTPSDLELRSEIAYGAFVLCLNKAYPPLYCINKNQHDFKGWGKNQRIIWHDTTWFLTVPPVEKWFPRACDGQYSLVSFLVAVLLVTVSPCPAIRKSGARVPRAPWSRRRR